MMPEECKFASFVKMHCYGDAHLAGLEFIDRQFNLIFKVGRTDGDDGYEFTTVEIRDNEQIIGVKAKILP